MALRNLMGVMAVGLVVAPALLNLDIDGFLTGSSFLTVLANALSTLFIAIFSVFTGGLFGGSTA
jgi:hypothetical protein